MNTALQCHVNECCRVTCSALVARRTRFWQARKEEEGPLRPSRGEPVNAEKVSAGHVPCVLCCAGPLDTAGPALKEPPIWLRRDSAASGRDARAVLLGAGHKAGLSVGGTFGFALFPSLSFPIPLLLRGLSRPSEENLFSQVRYLQSVSCPKGQPLCGVHRPPDLTRIRVAVPHGCF